MGFFIYSNTFAIIEFDIHETIFIFSQSKYILQKYYFGGGQKFMHVSYNEWSLVPNLRPEMWWPMSLWKSLRYYFDLQNPEPEGCCQYFWMGAWEAHCSPRPQTLCLPFPGSICDGAFSGHLDLNLIR